jgi:ADP-ribose pyrophosphatase YjhB (NUDIX family)
VPTPDYITAIRRTYGSGPLLLPGVSGVVVDGDPGQERILLVERSDNGRWSLPAGIVEPGEQPADTITREILEETCVSTRADRLVLLSADPEITYPNGDRCQFLSMCFRCSYVGGEAGVGDEESTDVRWFGLSALPVLSARDQRRIACALAPAGPTQFDTDQELGARRAATTS